MPRLVQRYRNQPYTLIVAGESVSICGCGLSAKQPYCDGTHVLTEDEDAKALVWYDEAGSRHAAGLGELAGIRSDTLL